MKIKIDNYTITITVDKCYFDNMELSNMICAILSSLNDDDYYELVIKLHKSLREDEICLTRLNICIDKLCGLTIIGWRIASWQTMHIPVTFKECHMLCNIPHDNNMLKLDQCCWPVDFKVIISEEDRGDIICNTDLPLIIEMEKGGKLCYSGNPIVKYPENITKLMLPPHLFIYVDFNQFPLLDVIDVMIPDYEGIYTDDQIKVVAYYMGSNYNPDRIQFTTIDNNHVRLISNLKDRNYRFDL